MAGSAKINSPQFFISETHAIVFIRTDCNNNHVIASLNDSNVAGSIKNVFADSQTNNEGITGIVVQVLFSGPVRRDSIVILTVQQDDAAMYGESEVFIPRNQNAKE